MEAGWTDHVWTVPELLTAESQSRMTNTRSDRRQFPRTEVSFHADVWATRSGPRASGHLVVLGGNGAFLELDDAFPVGSLMHVRFELPTLGEIGCRAIVRNAIEDTGVGVEFLDIEGVEHRRIVAFVTQHQAPTPVHYPPPA